MSNVHPALHVYKFEIGLFPHNLCSLLGLKRACANLNAFCNSGWPSSTMLICDIVTEWWTLLQDGGWLNIWFSTSHHKQWRYDGILYLALNGNISHRLCSAIGALPRWRSSAASWPPQPPMFHFREKGFCWQKNPLSVIVMLIISYAKWAWQRQCSSRKDSCWREQPLRRLIVSEEAQRK